MALVSLDNISMTEYTYIRTYGRTWKEVETDKLLKRHKETQLSTKMYR